MQWIAIAKAPMNEMLAWAVCDAAGEGASTCYDRASACLRLSVKVSAQSAAWAAMAAELELKTWGVPELEELRIMAPRTMRAEMLAESAGS